MILCYFWVYIKVISVTEMPAFFSVIFYCKILNIVLCAIQQIPLVYHIKFPFVISYERSLTSSAIKNTVFPHPFSEAESESESISQSFLTLCNPRDYRLPGSSVQGILQGRIMEWVAILFCRGSSQPRDQTQVSGTTGRFFTTELTGKPKKNFFLNA